MKRRSRDIREPIPLARAISWRPLRGVDHVLAMLQPGGTHREIFIAQETLSQLDTTARSAAPASAVAPNIALSFGLLLGELYECPNTRAKYVVIDSLSAHAGPAMESAAAASAIVNLMAPHHRRSRHILGWYCATHGGADLLSPEEEAFHRTYFDEPWHTALRLTTDLQGGVAGTFLRRGALDPRAFRIPFYELLDRRTPIRGAKPTCIVWPTYVTADSVITATTAASDRAPSTPAAGTHEIRKDPGGPSAWRAIRDAAASMTRRHAERPAKPTSLTSPSAPPAAPVPPPRSAPAAASPTQHENASAGRWGDPAGIRRPGSADELGDTSASDRPGHYVEIARADGFFLASRFDFTPQGAPMESLWVLQDPFAGLLLLVSTSGSTITDATLHYNLYIDDPNVLDTTFSEYRDVESQTIYVKDACADGLRARCAALRESRALRPEWIVSPTLYFLTPSEWEWLADASFDSGRAVRELNRSRILSLPEPVIRRFRLAGPQD